MASATSPGLVYTPANTPFHGSATVVVSDTMPTTPPQVQAPAAGLSWWRDPWKLGLVALGGVVVLTLLMPRRD